MERYSEYKDSGVKWLGEIPRHWEMKRWRFLMVENTKKNSDRRVRLQLQFRYGDIVRKANQSEESDVLDTISKYTVVEPNDIMINGLNLNYDFVSQRVAQVNEEGAITSAYISLRPTNIACPKYYTYFLKSMDSKKMFHGMGTGIRLTLSYNELKNQFIPRPSIEEQEAIANYLDAAASKIDEAIAQQQKMIDLLIERKQIIINNAVTKGLGPNVPMKDSGVEWIGKIPEHWEVRKLGTIGSTINGVSHDSSYFGEGEPFVSYSDVYKNYSLPKFVSGLAKSSKQERRLFSVERGDVFFTRTSETAEEIGFTSTCLETIPNAVFAGFLIRFRPNANVLDPNFSKYYFRAHIHRSYFVKEMNLVIRASLSQQLLKGLPILLPSLQEQYAIASYLDSKINEIDLCLDNKTKQISLLQERKQIIINDVVTGKVKVL